MNLCPRLPYPVYRLLFLRFFVLCKSQGAGFADNDEDSTGADHIAHSLEVCVIYPSNGTGCPAFATFLLRRAGILLLSALACLMGCANRGYQFAQPPGFSSTYQRYCVERQQYPGQPLIAKSKAIRSPATAATDVAHESTSRAQAGLPTP